MFNKTNSNWRHRSKLISFFPFLKMLPLVFDLGQHFTKFRKKIIQ